MSTSKYVSEVKTINQTIDVVYHFLSDFNNLSKLLNDNALEQISAKMPNYKITNFSNDADSCNFEITGLGKFGFQITDRDEPQTIKIKGVETMPLDLTFWIQLLPASPTQTKLKLTLHAELNMMMKMVIGNKLDDGINKLADMIAIFPYIL